jgi:hypothetical protein
MPPTSAEIRTKTTGKDNNVSRKNDFMTVIYWCQKWKSKSKIVTSETFGTAALINFYIENVYDWFHVTGRFSPAFAFIFMILDISKITSASIFDKYPKRSVVFYINFLFPFLAFTKCWYHVFNWHSKGDVNMKLT